MHIDQLNIHNLTSLWKKYGEVLVMQQGNSKLKATQSWPYRCWVEGEQNLTLQISQTPKTHRLFSWPYPLAVSEDTDTAPLLNKDWHLEFDQTAMYLELDKFKSPTQQQNEVDIRKVEDFESLAQWVQISSEAFGYEVDEEVFRPLLSDHDIEIYIGFINQQPAVSALLYKTGKVTGLHQMGVKQKFQGLGAAKKVMYQLLVRAQLLGTDYMVLQASRLGSPLYLKLGFQEQFRLLYFRFTEDTSGAQ